MKNRGWTLWLVIFLCALVFGFGWIVIGNRQSEQIDLLNQEIKRLDKEIEKLINYTPTSVGTEIKESTESATPSARPSPVSTSSSFLIPQSNTNSGCSTCGE